MDQAEGWYRTALESVDLEQDAHYYERVSQSADGRLEGFKAFCGLEIYGQNMDLDISEIPILPICRKCLAEYKRRTANKT